MLPRFGDAPIEVAAAVVVFEGKILLARRHEGELAGLWEFPGGKLEPLETSTDAAERELLEELNLCVTAHERLLVLEHQYPTKRVRLHFVRCTPVPGNENLARKWHAEQARWFGPKDPLPSLCPADALAWKQMPWARLFHQAGAVPPHSPERKG